MTGDAACAPDGRPWQGKVDHRLRALVEGARDGRHDADGRVMVFVRFRGEVERLRGFGLETGTVAGDVAVASVSLADVPRAAADASIVFIELSRPLAPDGA